MCEEGGGHWKEGGCRCAGKLVMFAGRCLAATHEVAQMTPALSGLYAVYSPSVLTHEITTPDGERKYVTSMWTGGWLTKEEVGPDNIYRSELVQGKWSRPTMSFQRPGFHVNDPSVLVHPKQKWLFMYYTALDNVYANDKDMTERNWVGFASSINGGKSWDDHGIVIGQDNGLDGTGAWSPSAVLVGSEIWVYYHTNSKDFSKPITLRTRFSLDGWKVVGATERLSFPDDEATGEVTLLSNLDVAVAGSKFIMVANSTGLNSIRRFVSKDGLSWLREPRDPLIAAGADQLVLTPHLHQGPHGYRVYFGYDEGKGSGSIQAWDFSQ